MAKFCAGPRRRLLMHRTKNLVGPYPQFNGFRCIRSTGNFLAPGMPGSGPQALFGVVDDATTIRITFTQCVSVSAVTGIEYQIDAGSWVQVSSLLKISDTVWTFATGNLDPGDEVRWRYVGGSGTILDCDEAEDIGNQEVPVDNPLVLAGDFILLESGGMDVVLLEDALVDPDDAIVTEDAP